jgi:hypothetical protein
VQGAAEFTLGFLFIRVFTFLDEGQVVEYMEYNALVNFLILSLRVVDGMTILVYMLYL